MKPAADAIDSGIVETTTRRRVLPNISLAPDQPAKDLWEYLAAITETDWRKHMVYGYRTEPAPKVPIFKCGDPILQMPNGQRVALADEQEMEFALLQNFGGGAFRILVKSGSQIVTAATININAPARPITIPLDASQGSGAQNGTTVNGMSDSAQIAGKAIDAISGQEHQAVNLGLSMMSTAANVVRNFGTGAQPDPVMQQMMQVLIARALAPPPDPLELLAKMIALMTSLSPARTQDETTGTIMKAALDRLLNPTPAGAPVSIGAEIARQIPQLGTTIAEGLREFRLAREAELQMMQLSRTGAPGQPQMLPPSTAAPPSAPAPAAGAPGAPSMDFVDKKIIEILQRPVSAEQAADDAMAFLSALDASALDQLSLLGEGGMLAFFQSRPILKAATNNMPRLVEFIRAFLKMHAEDKAAEAAGQPPPKGAQLPN